MANNTFGGRQYHASTYDSVNDVMYVGGGFNATSQNLAQGPLLADLLVFSFGRWSFYQDYLYRTHTNNPCSDKRVVRATVTGTTTAVWPLLFHVQ